MSKRNESLKKIVLSNGFNRSTNLEMDYQDSKRLDEIYFTDKFMIGIEEILESIIVENSNQRVRVLSGSPGLGKSTFALMAANLVSKKNPLKIKSKIEKSKSHSKKNVEVKFNNFQKSKKTKLLPIFLNGYLGEIEDAFVEKLGTAFETEGLAKEFSKIVEGTSKNYFETINKWKKSFPEIYKKYQKFITTDFGDIQSFEKQLKSGKAQAKESFERFYSEATGGAQFEIKSSRNVIEIFKKSITVLQSFGYQGLFVIYDEFGKYLERGIHNPSSINIQFLQDFAEFCDRSGEKQCHLTLITHLSVSQYASQLPISVQKEWAKIEGRFNESSFYDRGTDNYEMISHVFEKTIKDVDQTIYKKAKREVDLFMSSIEGKGLEFSFERKDFSNLVLNCYPLHPITFSMLPILSQKVAQNERTLYTFLTRDEQFSLKRFIQETTDDFKWLTPFYLYQYFAPLVAKDIGIGGSYKINLMIEDAMGKIDKDDVEGREILSLIGLCSIIKNFNQFPITKEFILPCFESIFEKKKLEKSFKNLCELKILYFNKILKQYELQHGSSVDIDEEIEKYRNVKLTSKDLVRIVKDYFPQDYIIPKRYNYNFSITRFAPVNFLSVEEFKAGKYKQTPDFLREDALVYYIIPFDQEELEQARKLAKEKVESLVVYVIPKTFIEVKRDIEELNAINSLFNNREILQAGPMVKKELQRHKTVTLNAIRSMLEPLVGKFKLSVEVFNCKQEIHKSVSHYSELSKLFGELLELEYSKYVPLNSELINKQKVPGAITLARKDLIDAMTYKRDEKNLGFEGQGPEVSIYKSMQAAFGLKISSEKFLINKNSKLFELFNSYEKWLYESDKGIEASQIFERLMAPPYGIRRSVIPLLIYTFDQMLDYPVSHYYLGEYQTKIDGEHYEMMFKYPKDCIIKYVSLTKAHSEYLNKLGQVLNVSSKSPTVTQVLEGVYVWRKTIPEYTKENPELKSEFRKFLIAIDSATEPEKLIFKMIPEAFGCSGVSSSSTSVDIKKIVDEVLIAKNDIPKFYMRLVESLHTSLIEFLIFLQSTCLGEKGVVYSKGMNLASLYQQTLDRFPLEVKKYPFNKLTANLLNRIRTFDSSKHSQYFVETLGDVLTQSNPRSWSEKGQSLFEANLAKCKTEIEMVFELLSPTFNGTSVVAFINRQSGEKEYVRLGLMTTTEDKFENKISDMNEILKGLSINDRNTLLIQMMIPENSDSGNVKISESKGIFIK